MPHDFAHPTDYEPNKSDCTNRAADVTFPSRRMRFFVEVTPIGKTETQKYCVDAESWQKALQAARAMRKEDGSISGFSIELADDGYRAVDPAARIRYMVKKAPADASITTPSQAPPPMKASVPPPAPAAAAPAPARAAAPPQPAAPAAHPISVPPPKAEDSSKKMGGKTVSFASSGTALLANAPAQAPAVPRASPSKPSQSRAPAQPAPAAAAGLVTERKKPESVRPMPAAAPAPAAASIRAEPQPAAASTRSGAPIVVLYRKEQAPTAASPISYREEVFAAPPGTSEDHAEAILRAEFKLVTSALANAPAGKYVNLAVFDRVFEGRPPAPPLAILSWKDWKPGDPTVTFPRRQREKLSSATQPSNLGNTAQNAQAQIAQVVAEVASHLPAQTAAAPAPAPAHPPSKEARSVPPSTPPPRARIEPESDTVVVAPDYAQILDTPGEMPAMKAAPPPAIAAPEAHRAPVPVPAAIEPVLTPPPGAAALAQSGSTGSFRRARKPTPSAPDGSKIRVRGDELIALLFEEMHDLSFMADALEGAAFCLWVVLDKLPSKAAFVHFYDLEKREFVVASVGGAVGVEHAARRNSPNDPWLAEAMRRRTVYVTADAASHEGANVERFAAIGGARSVVVAPVMLGGRMLGAIEVVNPIDGNPFGEDDANAIQYMAEQFAEFVSSHGMVVDEARIRRASLNPPA